MRVTTLLMVLILPVFAGVLAAQITVTNLNDSGSGSLRQAIVDAQPGDVIDFAVSGTITLNGEALVIGAGKDITIEGPGAAELVIDAGGMASPELSSVFAISGGADVTIRNLTITGGVSGFSDEEGGAGVRVSGGARLALEHVIVTENNTFFGTNGGGLYAVGPDTFVGVVNCSFADNVAAKWGGGIFLGEGVEAVIQQTSITNNTVTNAFGHGGGIYVEGGAEAVIQQCNIANNTAGGHGGGIHVNGSPSSPSHVTLDDTRIADNFAGTSGGGIHATGISGTDGVVIEMTSSSIVGNRAGADGGGVRILRATMNIVGTVISNNKVTSANPPRGGGIWAGGGSNLTLRNTTIAGNSASGSSGAAGQGGGICVVGVFNYPPPVVTLTHVTLTDNHAGGDGGGIHEGVPPIGHNPHGQITLNSTLVASNSAGGSDPDLSGQFISDGYNLIGNADDSSGFTHGVNNDIVGNDAVPVDAKLGVLGDWGGPTRTVPLLAGSPAVGAGDPALPLATDQRGVSRSAPPDIGAFESIPPPQFVLVQDSTLTEIAPGDFSLTLDPGDPLGDASFEIIGSGDLDITVTITPPANPPAGVIAPEAPPPGLGPFTLTWSGTAGANPGTYLWRIDAHDAGGVAAQAFVTITITGDGGGNGGGGPNINGGGGAGGGCASGSGADGAGLAWLLILLSGMLLARRGLSRNAMRCRDSSASQTSRRRSRRA